MKTRILTSIITLFTVIIANAQCPNSQIPYVQNFEESPVPGLPPCTEAYLETFVGNNWETGFIQENGTNNTVVQLPTASSDADFMMATFLTNWVNLQAGVSYKISLRYGNTNPDGVIQFFSLHLHNWSNQITQLELFENVSEGGTYVSGPISIDATGIYKLNVGIQSSNNQGTFFVDDIVIEEWDCHAPEGLAVTDITDTGATLSWTDNDAPNFEYIILPQGVTPEFGIANTSASVTVNELEPGTNYTAYLRGYCFDSWSTWSPGVNFTTTGIAGIGDNTMYNVKAFPNPVKDILNITYTDIITDIELYNPLGQLIDKKLNDSDSVSINLETYTPGAYFLTLRSGDKQSKVKIIKE